MAFSFLRKSVKLPDFSCMMKVGQLRCIQSIHESGDLWNPDVLVSQFLSPSQRWSCFWRGALLLNRLRSDPFYYYVVARTKYYDAAFLDALRDGVTQIINVGCGSDTRAYRYAHLLMPQGASVLECDQTAAIQVKQDIACQKMPVSHVEYLPIDLNDDHWHGLKDWLDRHKGTRMLVLMEGVSPYVHEASFGAFLGMLAGRLAPDSRVAYDFKIRGLDDAFGSSGRTLQPFRLSADEVEVCAFHQAHGFQVHHLETSAHLSRRLLPSLATLGNQVAFHNDGLVQLRTPISN
jgi:methyltransferase (TIGR00027 family)